MGLNRVIVAGGTALAASALAGCGSSGGLLSRDQASRLQAELDRAQGALAAGRCQDAASAARELVDSVQSLGGVDSTLVSNLVQGANQVMRLTAHDCRPSTPAPPPPPKPTVTRTVTTVTTPATTPSTTSSTATDTTQTVTPPLTTSTTGGGGLNTTSGPATSTTPATTPTPATSPSATTPQTSTSGGAGLAGPGQ